MKVIKFLQKPNERISLIEWLRITGISLLPAGFFYLFVWGFSNSTKESKKYISRVLLLAFPILVIWHLILFILLMIPLISWFETLPGWY
ncbi:hypothetical protein FZW96_14350 [Bacillus sp. BGMRC 2118]|nr:hypothetical protein FZW96_14350 [Bacillus sp. BGMRC 2118]